MKTIIELNENDIAMLIAEHFDADVECIYVRVEQEMRGYGVGEHVENVVRVRVEK